jgi:uncharacterized membrane protein YozB (DUF420 family)
VTAPLWSTFSAIAEVFVTAGVLYVVIRNYRQQGFAARLAATVIAFEFSVNMMYMIFRMRESSTQQQAAPNPLAPFLAAHGILSLLVFVLFVVFAYLAYVAFKRGRHFFYDHAGLTWTFLFLWLLSVGSGEVLYGINYL